MKRGTVLPATLAAVFLGSLASMAPASAAAEGVPAQRTAPVSIEKFEGSKPADGASASASCAIDAYGHRGYRVCGFDYFRYNWGGGNYEYFVVGTNYRIYHIWKGAGGWKSLGGVARSAAPNGTYATDPTGVATIGTDNRCWWRPRGNGSWPGTW
ncbi:hypothetical protein GR925_21115 [Streptomyces sp. HUCO-GS316]|uniref:hypothetical protein n=1 Tax=Streptomyces sp. HUCO-GS316 TaxID=2692198 RepID=UPI001371AA47|nr:hypothetical protein [Streptomyces sp. HUCO-GS316]MXM65881.1 hypothetical protein [Streptomyces sp. HUCO-GS316]